MSQPVTDEEPDTLGGVYDDLIGGLEETLLWAQGSKELTVAKRSLDPSRMPPVTTSTSDVSLSQARQSLYRSIADEIAKAAQQHSRVGMFQYQVLVHASQLRDIDAEQFCHVIGVPNSYVVEFRKMMKVADLIAQNGQVIRPSRD